MDVMDRSEDRSGRRGSRTQALRRQWLADVSLLLVALIWGATFVLVKDVVSRVDPIALVAVRFLMAAAIMAVPAMSQIRKLDVRLVEAGVAIGLTLFAGYAFQTMGLEHTTASKSGFITGLSVVLVPIFSTLILGSAPDAAAIVGAVCATVGLGFLTLNVAEGPLFGVGDLLSLFGAAAFGLHIALVGRFAPRYNARLLVVVQLAAVSLISFVITGLRIAVLRHEVPMPILAGDLAKIGFLALFGTALAFFAQNVAQKSTSPTHVAIIFAMEPVFAGLFGWLLLGETLARPQYLGAALIVAGMLVSEMPWKRGDAP